MSKKNKYSGNSSFTLRIAGEEMQKDQGYSLSLVLETLGNFEQLVNETYLASYQRQRFTQSDADKINLRITDVKEGSFLTELCVELKDIALPALPFVVDNKEFIWETIKTSIEFFKAKSDAKKRGKDVVITQNPGQKGISVVNNGSGTVNITTDQKVPEMAEAIRQPLQNMTKNVDGTGIETVTFSKVGNNSVQAEAEPIVLKRESKEMFVPDDLISPNPFSIRGKIVSGNYTTSNGKIEIEKTDSSYLHVGKAYNVTIADDLHAEDKWRDMFLQSRPYYCKAVINGMKIKRLMIVDWDPESWN